MPKPARLAIITSTWATESESAKWTNRAMNASCSTQETEIDMQYEMKNFIKFSKVSKVGRKTKRDEWKRVRKVARKNKQLARKVAR